MPPTPTILVTRPEAAAQRFAADLRAAGCTVPLTIAPILEIRPLPGALGAAPLAPDKVRGVILTSANGVEAFAAQCDLRPPAWCVGQSTARAAKAEGFDVCVTAVDADDLLRVMVATGTAGPFLHACGRHVRGDLAQRLTLAGLPTDAVALYDQIARPLGSAAEALLQGGASVILPLFSPRSARLLAKATQRAAAPLHLVAISDAAARAWAEAEDHARAATLRCAARPDAEAMRAATLAAVAEASGA